MSKKWWIGFVVIALVTIIIYLPSCNMFFPGTDILRYFLETKNDNAWGLIFGHLSYPKTKIYFQSDTLFYRPLMFALLGLEKWLFEAHHIPWQVVNLLLHLAVVFCLYRLLLKIKPNIYAWLLTFLFSVWFIFLEIVIWSHIGMYLLFSMFVLLIFYYYDKPNWIWFISLFMACFSYEVGVVLCLLIGIHRHRAAFIPVALFAILYFFDKIPPTMSITLEAKNIFNLPSLMEGFIAIPRVFLSWLQSSCFLNYTGGRFSSHFLGLRYIVFVLALVYCIFHFRIPKKKTLLLLVSLIALFHISINCLVRVGSQTIYYLIQNVKQTPIYMFWVYMLILIHSCVDFKRYGGIFLCLFTLFNVFMVYRANILNAQKDKPLVEYMDKMNSFIRIHKKEPDFSFAVEEPIRTSAIIKGFVDIRPNSKREKEIIISWEEVFFGRYYKRENPKYLITK